MRIITKEMIMNFERYLISEEKSAATLEKYLRDVKKFSRIMAGVAFEKKDVIKYKAELANQYAPASVNSILSSLNSFFSFMGWHDLKVKTLKIQKQIFASGEKELTKIEYEKLLKACEKRKNKRLFLVIQTICSTGIRISELKYITVSAVNSGSAEIYSKGKGRIAFLPRQLCRFLREYIRNEKIKCGSVFVSKNGNPLDRSNVWSEMKKLCGEAGVSAKKVFPHNLRHLFARTYYTAQKDIVRLADLLGHSSVNTTRIYTIESGDVHRMQIQNLGLLRDSSHNIDYVVNLQKI